MASGAPASSSGNEAVDEVIVYLPNLEELLFLLAGSGPQADVLCKKLLLAVPACVLIHLKQHRTLLAALKQAALSRQNAAFQSGISPGKKASKQMWEGFPRKPVPQPHAESVEDKLSSNIQLVMGVIDRSICKKMKAKI